MQTTGHLDWISVTFPFNFNINILSPLVGDWLDSGKGPHGYQAKHVSKLGAYAYSQGEKRMGVHVTMGGQVLSQIRELGIPDRDILYLIASHHGRCSRIDVCVNMVGSGVAVQDLYDLCESGKWRSPSKLGKRYVSPKGQEREDDGFYVGAPTSDRRLRVYDKGLETRSLIDWLRVELQTNKKKAHGVQGMLTESESTRGAINNLIQDFCTIFHPAYMEALRQKDGDLPVSGRKEEAFWKWIRLQVAPSLAKRQNAHPEEDVIDRIEAMVDELLEAELLKP